MDYDHMAQQILLLVYLCPAVGARAQLGSLDILHAMPDVVPKSSENHRIDVIAPASVERRCERQNVGLTTITAPLDLNPW